MVFRHRLSPAIFRALLFSFLFDSLGVCSPEAMTLREPLSVFKKEPELLKIKK